LIFHALADCSTENDLTLFANVTEGANGDKAIEFNWMLGHGTAPKRGKRATSDQNKFERLKVHMKANATWFVYNSTPEELAE
jgi:hypothetical protein